MPHPAVQQFIQEHLHDDVTRLLLSAHKYPDIPIPFVVAQLEALRKIKDKVPSWYQPALEFPPLLSVEQSSSEVAARFKAGLFSGQKAADLTGGMGVDAYFWSQSFHSVAYVERNEELCRLAAHNYGVLNATNIHIHCQTAADFLAQNTTHFDLIYLDPARRDAQNRRLSYLADCSPDVIALQAALLRSADRVLIKTAPMLDLSEAIRQLNQVSAIWILSSGNECKEVLYLLEPTPTPEARIPVTAVLLKENLRFTFFREEERAAENQYAPPLRYLYEPDAAIYKAGAFKLFGARFGLHPLHPDTHLYTSDALVHDIPGRSFEILAVCKYDLAAIKPWLPEGKAHIAARNFPDTTEVIRKKLKLKDGGDKYLFAATLQDQSKKILVCQKTR